MHRRTLAEHAVFADHHARSNAVELVVLRLKAHTGVRPELCTSTNDRRSMFSADVVAAKKLYTGAELDAPNQHAIWADRHIIGEFAFVADRAGRVDLGHVQRPW